MKKLLLYSLAITIFSLVTGAMFVYGVFDFNDGKSQLIGTNNQMTEFEIHNEVVKGIHNVSSNAIAATENLIAFEIYDETQKFQEYFSKFKSSKKRLLHIIEDGDFSFRQSIIRDKFNETYLLPIEQFETIGFEIAAYLNEDILDEEKIADFKIKLQTALDQLIKAHNGYIVTLNKKRRY